MMIRKSAECWLCRNIIEHLQTERDLLCSVITGDETLNFENDLKTKQSVEVFNVAEAEESKTKSKVMFITFFNLSSFSHIEFLPQGQTIS